MLIIMDMKLSNKQFSIDPKKEEENKDKNIQDR
jgi:hypothetical protein